LAFCIDADQKITFDTVLRYWGMILIEGGVVVRAKNADENIGALKSLFMDKHALTQRE
jgi:hypothetical protein